MKSTKYFLTIAWLVMASQAMADDFTIADFSINPGETKTISIELNNTENSYIAFEFYLTFPEGISIPEDEDGYLMAELNSDRINRHVLEVSKMDDGSYHFLCYSNRNNILKGTSGEIISLYVAASETAPLGNYEGKLFSQKLSDPEENKVVFDDFTFHVNIGNTNQQWLCPHGCQLGDMNHDGKINVSDIMIIVNIILGNY